ncbi:MAG: tRNA (N(6)-L-threonylcarbamoyladenosine(37)-C(2))-methylthiotransferase MtaB [Candidatus Aminicenantes bacterium]|nr:tRNA (N(6)-L-threonylcarbamoyladenosine(37)-C(2))-methylthiotransferase MtaB [Candidatus Aminicenantes bacterium]
MTSFSIQSFGCRVNQAETFAWVNEFQKYGLRFKTDHKNSDIILVNTCTVTHRADRDVRGFLRKILRTNPDARLVLTGCSTERIKEEWERFPQVWKIVSNREKENIRKNLFPNLKLRTKTPERHFRSRALIKIQEGCDLACRFCIVPSVRGKSTSRTRQNTIRQVRECVSQGYNEIVLTGVHLCLYGLDLEPKCSLLDLLEDLEDVPGLKRIRLSSLDPRFLNEALRVHLTSSAKICPHFHFSLQSGTDGILRSMGRRISVDEYRNVLGFFRDRSPLASLGADILVGFPGESDGDFENTQAFLKDSPLTYFHVFVYSPRPGTPASDWTQVGEKVKTGRAFLLRELSRRKNLDFRRLFTGKECDAVVINKDKQKATALTSNYIKVELPSAHSAERETVVVKINRVTREKTYGEIVQDSV